MMLFAPGTMIPLAPCFKGEIRFPGVALIRRSLKDQFDAAE